MRARRIPSATSGVVAAACSILCCGWLLTACGSPQKPVADLFIGEHFESKMADGVYRIWVRTNWRLWGKEDAARRAWRLQARTLCGSDQFRELQVEESASQPAEAAGAIRPVTTTRTGVAICPSATLSDDAVAKLVGG